jgi:leucine-rich repeat transmembrane neuronal protein 1/2
VILLASIEIKCPEECRCEFDGYYINCSGSALNSSPSNLPTHVRILVLDGNNLTYFENDSFVSRRLVELHILKADFCNIRKIELGAFNGLTKLTKLSMEGNEISEIIPGTFEKISQLEYLDLDYNTIEHLEVDVFSGLVNLKYIDLKGNQLQYLHPDIFIGLLKIQTLDLSNNPGLQIPTDSHLINSHSLKYLAISHCNVRTVSGETFANVSALEWLDLSYNNLMGLDISILKVLPKLSTL